MSTKATCTGSRSTTACWWTKANNTKTTSIVAERGRKPNCGSLNQVDRVNHVQCRLNKTFWYTLAKICVSEIARKELTSNRGPLPLYNTKFSDVRHCVGTHVAQKRVRKRARKVTSNVTRNALVLRWGVNPSGHGADLGLMLSRAAAVSLTVMSTSNSLSSCLSGPMNDQTGPSTVNGRSGAWLIAL